MAEIIKVKKLQVNFGQNKILREVSFSVTAGDFIGVAGPNGAGKTTLIKVLLGLVPLTKGSVSLFGQDLCSFSDWGRVGYLPQKASNPNPLFPAAVKEIVKLGLLSTKKIPRIMNKTDEKTVLTILNELEIADLKDRMLSELSGGQQQRVMLARTLVSRPEILIFDEPSTALDPEARSDFFHLIKKLNKEKEVTIILITHDVGYIGRYANKLLYLDHKLIHFGKISDFSCDKKDGHYFEKTDKHVIWHQHE